MNRTSTRRRFLTGAALTGLTALAGCSGATPFVGKRIESDHSFDVKDATAIEVATDIGDIRIRGTDRDAVDVHAVKKGSSVSADLSKLHLETTRSDGRLLLESQYTGEKAFFGGTPTMDLTIRVPRSLGVSSVETGVGDIQVTDTTGDVAASTSTGDVTLRNVDGLVEAKTSTGDIVVESVRAIGDVEASTGDLDLAVHAINGDTTFETSTGTIVAAVDPGIDADFAATASVGDVSVDGLSLSDRTSSTNSVTGTLGDGGPDLEFSTNTGDVSVSTL